MRLVEKWRKLAQGGYDTPWAFRFGNFPLARSQGHLHSRGNLTISNAAYVVRRGLLMALMYGKLFASLYQGTLRGKSDEILVFCNLIAFADVEGFVDKHFRAISDETGLPIDRVKAAIEYLESPDPESRSSNEDGRRLVRIDTHRAWGWKLVNHSYYRGLRNEIDRRAQNREAQRRWRERVADSVSPRKPSVSEEEAASAESARLSASASPSVSPLRGSAEGERDSVVTGGSAEPKRKRFKRPTIEECRELALKHGMEEKEGDKFFHYYESNGWKVNRNSMQSSDSAMVNWRERKKEFYGSDKQNGQQNPRNVNALIDPTHAARGVLKVKRMQADLGKPTGNTVAKEVAGHGSPPPSHSAGSDGSGEVGLSSV